VNDGQIPLGVVAKGAMAGLVGGLAIVCLIRRAQEVAPSAPGLAQELQREEPNAQIARRLARSIFGVELGEAEDEAWGQVFHWGYSALWGVLYGLVQSSLRLPWWLHGALLGAAVWASGHLVLLPRMKLLPPPEDRPPRELGIGWAMYTVYGLTTPGAFRLLSLA